MMTIGHVDVPAEVLSAFLSAFPDARLIGLTPRAAERLDVQDHPHVLIVGCHSHDDRMQVRLAALKARHPHLAVIVLLDASSNGLRAAFQYGLARLDGLLVVGLDDNPKRIRAVVERCRMSSVASVIEAMAAPLPPVLARPTLDSVLQMLPVINRPRGIAHTLSLSLSSFRNELRTARLFPPRLLLAWFRILLAARYLTEGLRSVEAVSADVGYASPSHLRHACKEFLGIIPTEVKAQGGLRFAGVKFRDALNMGPRRVNGTVACTSVYHVTRPH